MVTHVFCIIMNYKIIHINTYIEEWVLIGFHVYLLMTA